MRPELIVAAGIVVALAAYGITQGTSIPLANCGVTQVKPFSVFGVNFLLTLLLMSGVFTYGSSTLLFAVYVLTTTGATMGSIVARLGWEGVALLTPHGLLEAAAWVIAIAVGLAQPLAHLPMKVKRATRTGASDPEPLLIIAAKGVLAVAVVLLLAAVLESIWTGWYGQRIVC
jgi:uncharacterized membrane protein SpoIIM required for sporulation